MGHHRKVKSNSCREEESITAMFEHKLHALFQTNFRQHKQQCNKSKDKGGDKKSHISEKIKKTSRKSIEGIKYEIKLLIAFYGIGTPHINLKDQPKLSRERVSIMDIDFEGLYFKPDPVDLSTEYATARQNMENYNLDSPYQASDYDLNQIPIWEEMKKFNSFRVMQRPICRQLAKIGYNPVELNKLNYVDVLDMLSRHNYEFPNNRMPCQRTHFLKMFSACYGDEFVEKMQILGKEKEAKDFLIYIHYLGRVNQKCPADVRYTASLFNIHHVKNRKHAEELDDYSKVNDCSNLALCFNFPHHKILHTPEEIDLNPNIVFLGGFLREFQIARNPAKERLYQQGMIKARKWENNR